MDADTGAGGLRLPSAGSAWRWPSCRWHFHSHGSPHVCPFLLQEGDGEGHQWGPGLHVLLLWSRTSIPQASGLNAQTAHLLGHLLCPSLGSSSREEHMPWCSGG